MIDKEVPESDWKFTHDKDKSVIALSDLIFEIGLNLTNIGEGCPFFSRAHELCIFDLIASAFEVDDNEYDWKDILRALWETEIGTERTKEILGKCGEYETCIPKEDYLSLKFRKLWSRKDGGQKSSKHS